MSVYFITCREQGICKIGHAANPKSRRSSLQTAFPSPLVLEAVLPGSVEVERELHKRFAEHRLKGEWFNITAEIEAEIASAGVPDEGVGDQRESRGKRETEEERVARSVAEHRALFTEWTKDLPPLPANAVQLPVSSRPYNPVATTGGQFNDRFAIRVTGEHRVLCESLNLTWDQADRLCDVHTAERERSLTLPMPEPETRAA